MVIRISRYASMKAFKIHFPLFEIVFINTAADLVNGTLTNFLSPSGTHLCSGASAFSLLTHHYREEYMHIIT